jgi:hypothetical protein
MTNFNRVLDTARPVAKTYARGFRFEVAVLEVPGQGRRVLAYWLEHRPGEGWVLPEVTVRIFDVLDAMNAARGMELVRWLEEAAGAGPAATVTWRGHLGKVMGRDGSGVGVRAVTSLRSLVSGVPWIGIFMDQIHYAAIDWPGMAPMVDMSPEVARGVACAIRQILHRVHVLEAEVIDGSGDAADLARGVVDPAFGCIAAVNAGIVTLECAACGLVRRRRAIRAREGLKLRVDLSCPRCKSMAAEQARLRAAAATRRAEKRFLDGQRSRARRGQA